MRHGTVRLRTAVIDPDGFYAWVNDEDTKRAFESTDDANLPGVNYPERSATTIVSG